MPLVSRSDCTEIAAKEFWKFDWSASASSFSAKLDRAEIDFNACRGSGGNNDLFRFYKRLYEEGRTTKDDYNKIQGHIVGNNNCHIAVQGLLTDKGYNQFIPAGWEYGFCVTSTGADQNSGVVKLAGGDYGPDAESINECLELCKATAGNTGCEVIWGQGNRGCYVHTQEVARGNLMAKHLCYPTNVQ